MSNQSIVLTTEFICRELSNYADEVVQFKGSVAEYDLWFPNGPKLDEAKTIKNVKCFVCNHAGKPRTHTKPTNSDDRPAKKSRIYSLSIKVGCTAKFRYKEMLNGQVEVSYSREHKNHNPLDTSDIGKSKLTKDFKVEFPHMLTKHGLQIYQAMNKRMTQPHEGKIIDLLSALTRLYTYVVADLGSNNNIPTYYLTPSYLLSLPKVDTPISVEVVVELYPRGSGSSSAENTCTTSAT
ncbi:uncharacterized protein EV154DRAFT_570943 [Mucor mucedo]|uniref:uncharacterized protein n=1 Tax=Mucor mucedo TaxID=29922 RepID=UPI00221E60E9|nr:uncharacterized protein EV154DRAFT_570943 [Mucor mucedo]KAI7870283.1 hypothetical protein EV154DRAFT_570943 [Mucor mucedo]